MNTMKYMTTIAFIILSINIGFSQTWKEWFNQKKTQNEYLVKQIAALKVYGNYLKAGYNIAQKGLSMVSDIKGRNFGDHKGHFGSLKIVKDDLGNDSRIHLILTRQVAIINELHELRNVCRKSESLTREEVRYVNSVYTHLLKECERTIAELQTVISDGAYQMTDDERIESIEAIYYDMNSKYAFTRTFCGSTEMLIMQRSAEKLEIESARSLNGVL